MRHRIAIEGIRSEVHPGTRLRLLDDRLARSEFAQDERVRLERPVRADETEVSLMMLIQTWRPVPQAGIVVGETPPKRADRAHVDQDRQHPPQMFGEILLARHELPALDIRAVRPRPG